MKGTQTAERAGIRGAESAGPTEASDVSSRVFRVRNENVFHNAVTGVKLRLCYQSWFESPAAAGQRVAALNKNKAVQNKKLFKREKCFFSLQASTPRQLSSCCVESELLYNHPARVLSHKLRGEALSLAE